jgi:hypothetical protein
MLFKIKLLESDKQIAQNILKALLPDISNYLKDVIEYLKNNLPPVVRGAIVNTPEYQSLLNGQLKYEFGIPDPSSKLASLLTVWSTNIKINYSPPTISSSKIKASFSANMIKADFSDVLYTDYAAVYDTVRGYSLPWLEWLLLEGNRTIIKNQSVVLGPSKSSRTGFALMRDSSSSWRVPSEYSGTITDNWITRAIDSAENDINAVLERALQI